MSRWMETGCRSRVWRPRPTSTTRSFSSACSWLPSGSWPASGRCSRTKGMTPRVIALSAATSGSSPRSTRVGSHTDRDWASAAGQSSAATPGCLRTSAWPSAMIGLGSSSNRCCRAHASSWLQDASPENSENRLLICQQVKESERPTARLVGERFQEKGKALGRQIDTKDPGKIAGAHFRQWIRCYGVRVARSYGCDCLYITEALPGNVMLERYQVGRRVVSDEPVDD